MQAAAPEAVDLTKETEATRKLYGMDNEVTAKFGANCLLARRMVERGVRFINIYHEGWDAHSDVAGNVTTIERSSNGTPTAVVAPGGQRTALDVDTNGFLSQITNPAGESVAVDPDVFLLCTAPCSGGTALENSASPAAAAIRKPSALFTAKL